MQGSLARRCSNTKDGHGSDQSNAPGRSCYDDEEDGEDYVREYDHRPLSCVVRKPAREGGGKNCPEPSEHEQKSDPFDADALNRIEPCANVSEKPYDPA